MKKYLLFVLIILTSLVQEVKGQDVFTVPINYGFLCDEARYLCGSELDGFSSSLVLDQSPLPQPFPICGNSGTAENTQWFSFIADDTNLHLTIDFSNCTVENTGAGISTGIYMDCNLNEQVGDDLQIDCSTIQATNGTIDLIPDPLIIIPGNIYYLYLDGYDNSVCDFTISVVSGVCVEAIPPTAECLQDCGVSNALFDNHGCTGFEEIYSFEPSSQILDNISGCNPFENNAELDSIIHIDWEISPTTGFTILSTPMYYDSLDIRAFLTVDWTLPGTYTIKPVMSINPLYATCRSMCECTDDVVYTVIIEETVIDTLPLIELCPNSNTSVDFCGQSYNTDIDVTCKDRDNCTITVQEIRVLDRVDLPIDTHYICPNDCFEFNGMEYCDPNFFSVPSLTACDTFLQIQLIDLELDLSFSIAETMIDCDNLEARMTGEYTSNYNDEIKIFWLNEVGDTVSFAASYIALDAGTYTFYAVPLDAPGCFETLSNIVLKDDELPVISLGPPGLDCNNMSGIIEFSSTGNVTSVAWTGPNGYMSADQEPTITEGGNYTVNVMTSNGCPGMQSIEVIADFAEPDLQVIHDDFDCSENIPVAQFISTSDIVQVEWASLTMTSNDPVLSLPSAGNYTLTVTASNGCTAMESFTVIDNSYDPSLNLNEDYIWRCNDTEKTIDVTSQMDPTLSYKWTTMDGGVASNDNLLTVTAPGIFILTTTDTNLGCIGRDTVRILEDPNPFTDIEIVVNNPLCFEGTDGTIEIISFTGGEGPFTYSYEGVMYTEVEDINFPTGMQTISVFDQYECEVTMTFEVSSSQSFVIITEPEVSIKYGENGILTADVNIDDTLLNSIIWTDIDGNFLAEGNEVEIESIHETIMVTAEDINGCTADAIVSLVIDYEVDIFYPNVFSPNGDGTNDNFMIFSNGQPQSLDALQVFDRAGELIYQENDLDFNESQKGWNGEFNGRIVQPGVFVFMIQYTLGSGEQRSMSGSITVVR